MEFGRRVRAQWVKVEFKQRNGVRVEWVSPVIRYP